MLQYRRFAVNSRPADHGRRPPRVVGWLYRYRRGSRAGGARGHRRRHLVVGEEPRHVEPLRTCILLHTVERDDFELTVTERGEVEAFDVTEVRSLVKSNNTTGNAILRIVPEGTEVKKGDFLVELDSSALAASARRQKILVNAAKALEVEAHNNYDTAVIAKREYLEGTYLQERQTIESEVFVAEENLNRAKEYYAYSQKLASKGYVNENCSWRPIGSPSKRRTRTSTRPRRSCKCSTSSPSPRWSRRSKARFRSPRPSGNRPRTATSWSWRSWRNSTTRSPSARSRRRRTAS